MEGKEVRDRLVDTMLDKLEQTRYPSYTLLERLEESIVDRERAERYVTILVERIEEARFPSLPMLDRVNRLAALLG